MRRDLNIINDHEIMMFYDLLKNITETNKLYELFGKYMETSQFDKTDHQYIYKLKNDYKTTLDSHLSKLRDVLDSVSSTPVEDVEREGVLEQPPNSGGKRRKSKKRVKKQIKRKSRKH